MKIIFFLLVLLIILSKAKKVEGFSNRLRYSNFPYNEISGGEEVVRGFGANLPENQIQITLEPTITLKSTNAVGQTCYIDNKEEHDDHEEDDHEDEDEDKDEDKDEDDHDDDDDDHDKQMLKLMTEQLSSSKENLGMLNQNITTLNQKIVDMEDRINKNETKKIVDEIQKQKEENKEKIDTLNKNLTNQRSVDKKEINEKLNEVSSNVEHMKKIISPFSQKTPVLILSLVLGLALIGCVSYIVYLIISDSKSQPLQLMSYDDALEKAKLNLIKNKYLQ
jgi:hypothetical protein